ncbi:MAG: branched-chain amino acid ABC transporter permease [Rhodospirillales bacterium]|nr:branched-chain amino acid ABC transporter permease [Rhodospirillales bacterium]MSP79903.1 branched-chain amino acid ABC transporter permease [Rhodospirillales bacterium]
MLYREAGQFKATYQDDQAIFPIPQDRWGMAVILIVAFAVIPAIANDYWLRSILIPFLIYSLGAIGLNILTGYAGQLSLGTAGFMAVGAFAAYNFSIRLPEVPLLVNFALSGLIAAGVGVLFGLPSLRIKGFYLAVATLAAQFFLIWLFTRVGWFTNYTPSGVITAPRMHVFGILIDSSVSRYLLTLSVVAVLALAAKNMVRGNIGRKWMAIRDMDIAAEIIGISPLGAKLSAFAVSSFYCGVAGALWAYLYLGTVEPDAFGIDRSFQFLFMIIIGGLGSILGSFLGAGFIVLLPILITNVGYLVSGGSLPAHVVTHTQFMIFGALIVFFLIVEPHGLARLWQIGKEKLRLWPFPY